MSASVKTQCPFIFGGVVDLNVNTPVFYPCEDGTIYQYYSHFDGFDKTYNCQFCQLIWRKRDVFECLNVGEWKNCTHYKSAKKGSI